MYVDGKRLRFSSNPGLKTGKVLMQSLCEGVSMEFENVSSIPLEYHWAEEI